MNKIILLFFIIFILYVIINLNYKESFSVGGQSCDNVTLYNDVQNMQEVCCDEVEEDCLSNNGFPKVCNKECAEIYLSMWNNCSNTEILKSDPLFESTRILCQNTIDNVCENYLLSNDLDNPCNSNQLLLPANNIVDTNNISDSCCLDLNCEDAYLLDKIKCDYGINLDNRLNLYTDEENCCKKSSEYTNRCDYAFIENNLNCEDNTEFNLSKSTSQFTGISGPGSYQDICCTPISDTPISDTPGTGTPSPSTPSPPGTLSPPSTPITPSPPGTPETNMESCKSFMNIRSCLYNSSSTSCSNTKLICPEDKIVNDRSIDTSRYSYVINDDEIDSVITTCCSVPLNCSEIGRKASDVNASCNENDNLRGKYFEGDSASQTSQKCKCDPPIEITEGEPCDPSRCGENGSLIDPDAKVKNIKNLNTNEVIARDNRNCSCVCDEGYHGTTCNLSDNIQCPSDYCKNGGTVSGSYRYNDPDKHGCSCTCLPNSGWKGNKCDELENTNKPPKHFYTCNPGYEDTLNDKNQLCNKWTLGDYSNGKCVVNQSLRDNLQTEESTWRATYESNNYNLKTPYFSDISPQYYENCESITERWNLFGSSKEELNIGDYCSFECPSRHTALDIYGLVSKNKEVRDKIKDDSYAGTEFFTVGGQDDNEDSLENKLIETECSVLSNRDGIEDNENRIKFTCTNKGLVSDAVIGKCRKECHNYQYDILNGNCHFLTGGCFTTECGVEGTEEKLYNTIITAYEEHEYGEKVELDLESVEKIVEEIIEFIYDQYKSKIVNYAQGKIREFTTDKKNAFKNDFRNYLTENINNKLFSQDQNHSWLGVFRTNDDQIDNLVNTGTDIMVDFATSTNNVLIKDGEKCQLECKQECDYYGMPCNKDSPHLIPKMGFTNPFDMYKIDGKLKQCETNAKKLLSPSDGIFKTPEEVPSELRDIIISEKKEELDEDIEYFEALAYRDFLFCNNGQLQVNNKEKDTRYLCCPACDLGFNLESLCLLLGIHPCPDKDENDLEIFIDIVGKLLEKLASKEENEVKQEIEKETGEKWYDLTIEFPGIPFCWCFNIQYLDGVKEIAKAWTEAEIIGEGIENLPKILKFFKTILNSDNPAVIGLVSSSTYSPALKDHLDNIAPVNTETGKRVPNSDKDIDSYISGINTYNCSYSTSDICETHDFCEWKDSKCTSNIQSQINEKIQNIHKKCKKECEYTKISCSGSENTNLACDINCSESIDDFYSTFSEFNNLQENNIYYSYARNNSLGLLSDYISTCNDTNNDDKNSLRNSYCNNKYGVTSNNASMINNICFKDIDYRYITNSSNSASNSASNIKTFISSNCSNISNNIMNNFKDDKCQFSDSFNQNLEDNLNQDSNIYQKLQYIQHINNINSSCSSFNIENNCCPNNNMCKDGVPSQCNVSCANIFKNEEFNKIGCKTYLKSLFSDNASRTQNLTTLMDECTIKQSCDGTTQENCIPHICTTASNIPYEGCIQRDCTTDQNTPYPGCINASCTDTDTPYPGCANVPCNEKFYWDCTDPGVIDYDLPNLIDPLQENVSFVNECDQIDTQASEVTTMYNLLKNGESIISPISTALNWAGVCPESEDKTCDITDFDPLRRINNNCSNLTPDAFEDFKKMGSLNKISFARNNSECLCGITDYYNNCKDELTRIEDELTEVGLSASSIIADVPDIIVSLKSSGDFICDTYKDIINDTNDIIPRINSINASFIIDTEYHTEEVKLVYPRIQSKLIEYTNYLQDVKNYNSKNFETKKNKIERCIRYLEENDIDSFNNPFMDEEGGCQMIL